MVAAGQAKHCQSISGRVRRSNCREATAPLPTAANNHAGNTYLQLV